MRKLLLILGLLGTAVMAHGQTTAVTATITDPGGKPYVNCSWDIHTAAIPQSYNGRCNASGTLTQTVTSGVSWIFHFCDATGHTCGQATQTVNGATADLSAALSAAAPTLVAGPPQVIEQEGTTPLVLLSPNGANQFSFNVPDSGNPSLSNPNGVQITPGPLLVGASTPLPVLAGTSGGIGGTCNSVSPTPTTGQWGLICDSNNRMELSTGLNVNDTVIAKQFTVDPNPLTGISAPLFRAPGSRGLDHGSALRVLSPDNSHWLDINVPNAGDPEFVSSTGHITVESETGGPGTIGGGGGGPGGPTTFDLVGAGTNTAALVIGAGGTLTTAGTGAIRANALRSGTTDRTIPAFATGYLYHSGTTLSWSNTIPFNILATGTNTSGSMTVGTGAYLGFSGSGVVNANQVNGSELPLNAEVLATNSVGAIVAGTAAGGGDHGGLGDFRGVTLEVLGVPRGTIFGSHYQQNALFGPDPHNFPAAVPENTVGGTVGLASSIMSGPNDHLTTGAVYLSSGENEATGETEATGDITIRPGLVRSQSVDHPRNGALHVEMAGTLQAAATYVGGTLACTAASADVPAAGPAFAPCNTPDAESGKWVGLFAENTTAGGNTGKSLALAVVGNAYFRSYSNSVWTVGNAICNDSTNAGYLVALSACIPPRITIGVVSYTDPIATQTHYGIILSHHIVASPDYIRGQAVPPLANGFLRYNGTALAWNLPSLSDIGPSHENHTIESGDNYNEIASAFTDNGGGISWLLWDSSVDTNSSGQQLYIWNQGNNNVIPLDISLAGGRGLYVEDHSGDLVMQGTSGIRSPFLAGSCGADAFASEAGQWGMACSTTNITEEFIGYLREAMTAVSTTVQLGDAAHPAVHNGDLLLIDYEAMTVTNASDQENLVVTRGSNGTTPAAHLADKFVRVKVATTNHLMFSADGREPQELGAGGDFKGSLVEHMGKIHGSIFGNRYDRPAYFGPDPEHTPVTDPGVNARGAPVGLLSAPMAGASSGMRTGDVFIQTGENEGSGSTEGTGRIVIRPGLIAGHDVTSPQSGTLEIAIAGSIANPDAFPGGMLACVSGSGGNINFPAPQYAACSVADAEEGKYIGVFSEHLVTTGANSKGVSVSVVGNAYFTSYSSATWTAGQAICIDHDHDGYLTSSLHCSSRELMVGIVAFTDSSGSRQHHGILLSHR